MLLTAYLTGNNDAINRLYRKHTPDETLPSTIPHLQDMPDKIVKTYFTESSKHIEAFSNIAFTISVGERIRLLDEENRIFL